MLGIEAPVLEVPNAQRAISTCIVECKVSILGITNMICIRKWVRGWDVSVWGIHSHSEVCPKVLRTHEHGFGAQRPCCTNAFGP